MSVATVSVSSSACLSAAADRMARAWETGEDHLEILRELPEWEAIYRMANVLCRKQYDCGLLEERVPRNYCVLTATEMFAAAAVVLS